MIPFGWDWVELLRGKTYLPLLRSGALTWWVTTADYCIQNALPEPLYTRYAQAGGCRHELGIQGSSYFGALSHYRNEWDSKNATAHTALHSMLVFGNVLSGPFTLKRSKEGMLADVPRELRKGAITRGQGKRNIINLSDAGVPSSSGLRRSKRRRMQRQSIKNISQPPKEDNANLVPLAKSRLLCIETPETRAKSKWDFTPSEIEYQLEGLKTHQERLESRSPQPPIPRAF